MEDNAAWAGVAAGAMVLLATALIMKHWVLTLSAQHGVVEPGHPTAGDV